MCATICSSHVLIRYLVTVALTIRPFIIANCVSICNYILSLLLIRRIMPNVTNLVEIRLSLFKTNSVKKLLFSLRHTIVMQMLRIITHNLYTRSLQKFPAFIFNLMKRLCLFNKLHTIADHFQEGIVNVWLDFLSGSSFHLGLYSSM